LKLFADDMIIFIKTGQTLQTDRPEKGTFTPVSWSVHPIKDEKIPTMQHLVESEHTFDVKRTNASSTRHLTGNLIDFKNLLDVISIKKNVRSDKIFRIFLKTIFGEHFNL